MFPPFPHQDYLHHREEVATAVKRVLESGHYILGPEVSAFEAEFAGFMGAGHCIGLASGTDAIEVMLRALDIGTGAKVVVPSLCAVAVAAGLQRADAQVVFADCEGDTFTICPRSLEAVLKSPAGRGVKAALVVHLYGHVADWEGLQRVADEHGILLLEDCAQAHGATWQGRMAGTLGRAAAFSFYPTKNLAAMGDAGAVITSDDELAERVRVIRQYGWRRRYISDVEGVNSRLDELQAAILRVKLATLAGHLITRRKLAAQYAKHLVGVTPPKVRPGCEHAYHLHVVRSQQRDALMQHLLAQGVPVAVHYPAGIHQQPAYLSDVQLPETERAVKEVLSLPLHPYLTADAVTTVCDAVNAFHDNAAA